MTGPDPFFEALVAGHDPVTYLERLAALRPAWHREAACRGLGTAMFFPGRGEDLRPAQAICAGCPVTTACAAAAASDPLTEGIWAGVSTRGRHRARRAA